MPSKDFIDFLSRVRNQKEIIEKFGLSQEEINKLLEEPVPEFKLIRQKNVVGEELFRYQPELTEVSTKLKPRIWTFKEEATGKPSIAIFFSNTINWEKIRVTPISDVLFGNPACDIEGLDERVQWIARDHHVFAFINGDIFQKLATREKVDLWSLMEVMKKKLAPISHKILWAQQGCQETKILMSNERVDPLKVICNDFSIPYFDSPVYSEIHWRRQIFTFYCIHGISQAQKKGSKLNAAIKSLEFLEHTHFIAMSHIKDSMSKKVMRIYRDRRNFDLIEKKQFSFICPSFLKYFRSMESKKGYSPPSRGQINCALYANGDYHLYMSSPSLGIEENNNSKGGSQNGSAR